MSIDAFKIESGVPLVRIGHNRGKYPFRRLKVGESFMVACGPNEFKEQMNSLTSCSHWASYKTGFKFATRAVDGGIRVWRTQ
jgi:hypothetical protein